MKISYMLKREDFYSINEQTLKEYFGQTCESTELYVYPHLNAIVRSNPSKAVKRYIYTEYSVNGFLLKKISVWLYTRLCLNTFGLMAAKKVKIATNATRDILIYPCNRKYRIFDFKDNTVSVITKTGFPKNSIRNEIEFRMGCAPAEFILPIDNFKGDSYSERIIDGTPLARLSEGRSSLEAEALKMWREYSKDTLNSVSASQYADALAERIGALKKHIEAEKPLVDLGALDRVAERHLNALRSSEGEIQTVQSHGDLQSGNIWVEDKTGQIYIIDWESVEQRSVWYDEAVLREDLRKTHCFDAFAQNDDIRHTTVIIEEIIYRMNELCELPLDYGTDFFNLFISKLEKR